MKYIPAQLHALVGLPEQTFHGLPPLQGRNGYHPCFSADNALRLKIIMQNTHGQQNLHFPPIMLKRENVA